MTISDSLRRGLSSDDDDQRRASIEALTKIGPDAIDALGSTLREGNRNARLSAAIALANIRSERAVDALLPALDDEWSPVGEWAAEALGRINDRRAVVPLIAALRREELLPLAAEALGQIGDQRATPPLLQALLERKAPQTPREYLLVARVSHALLKLGCADENALGALRQVMTRDFPGHHTWPSFRAKAVRALGDVGVLGDAELGGLLTDNQPEVRLEAARFLLRTPSRREDAVAELHRIVDMKHLRSLARAASELLNVTGAGPTA
jgi:HEAT repeat protein